MVHTRRKLLAALPVAVLAPGVLAAQTPQTPSPAASDDLLRQLGEELRSLVRQAHERSVPAAEIARRSASTIRLLRSHVTARGIDASLTRYARSPRMRAGALEHLGDHTRVHDELRALGLTPADATRQDLEAILQRWSADPQAFSRLLGEAAAVIERAAPRMIGQAGAGATLRLVQSDACREWLFVAQQAQFYAQIVCLFAMMDPALEPLCLTLGLLAALLAELASFNLCW